MLRGRLYLLIACCLMGAQASSADSQTQTDWSGGSGLWGPEIFWGQWFYYADVTVDWEGVPGFLSLLSAYAEHLVDGYYLGASCVRSEDIDGDGDEDVLGTAYDGWTVTWWENLDGSGTLLSKHSIGGLQWANSVCSADIDDDGDADVFVTAALDGGVALYMNIGGTGLYWNYYWIDDLSGARSVGTADLDGDNDLDVLACGWTAEEVVWWENLGSGSSWERHLIDRPDHPREVHAGDIDGDGDMDVAGAVEFDGDIVWWENEDGAGLTWTKHVIDPDLPGAGAARAVDIDEDGDIDVAGCAGGILAWWENLDGSGLSWNEHVIETEGASVHAVDIDLDGDLDVVGSVYYWNQIAWWENLDGSGLTWAHHPVDSDYYQPSSAHAADLNGDGNADILGSSGGESCVSWWDLHAQQGGSLHSSVLDTGIEPDWDYIDWSAETPAGTSVAFQVRASDDYFAMGTWSDTLTSPGSLTGILADGDRYVQYKAILDTTDPANMPVLEDITISWDDLGTGDDPPADEYLLVGADPNPSSGSVDIGIALPELSTVELQVFDASGRLVEETSGEFPQGQHEVGFSDLQPGIYFVRMVSGGFSATERFVVVE
jgi:hypothetical protein